jgi:hypothetical protein
MGWGYWDWSPFVPVVDYYKWTEVLHSTAPCDRWNFNHSELQHGRIKLVPIAHFMAYAATNIQFGFLCVYHHRKPRLCMYILVVLVLLQQLRGLGLVGERVEHLDRHLTPRRRAYAAGCRFIAIFPGKTVNICLAQAYGYL